MSLNYRESVDQLIAFCWTDGVAKPQVSINTILIVRHKATLMIVESPQLQKLADREIGA